VHLFKRLQRLWELSAADGEFISREEYDALIAHLREVEAEMQDMSHRINDWIGVLMQSEVLRRKLDEFDDEHAK
jgi:hypothetical protein